MNNELIKIANGLKKIASSGDRELAKLYIKKIGDKKYWEQRIKKTNLKKYGIDGSLDVVKTSNIFYIVKSYENYGQEVNLVMTAFFMVLKGLDRDDSKNFVVCECFGDMSGATSLKRSIFFSSFDDLNKSIKNFNNNINGMKRIGYKELL